MAPRIIGLSGGFTVSALFITTAVQGHVLQDQPKAEARETLPAETDTATTTIIVTGQTPPVVYKADRTVYDLKGSLQTSSGTVADVLNTLPSVNATPDGNVTVRGQGAVQILVDGKPVMALTGSNRANSLQSMMANTISKIEVVTNPGAQFRSDSATIINIVTKQSQQRSGTGELTLNAGESGHYNASVSGSQNLGKLSLNGGLSLREDGRLMISHADRTHFDSDGNTQNLMHEDYQVHNHVRMVTLDAALSYALSDKDNLSLTGQATQRSFTRHIEDRIKIYNAEGQLSDDTITRSSGPENQDTASLILTYKHKGLKEGESFNISWRHEEVDPYSQRNYRVYDPDSQALVRAYDLSRNDRQLTDNVSGDYVLPLSGDRQWTAGFDIESNRNQSYNYALDIDIATGAETTNTSQTDRFLINQTLSAAYATYEAPVFDWTLQGGIRVENMQTDLRQSRLESYTRTSDTQWSPSLYLSRDISEANGIKLSYSQRIERPTANDLNPLTTNTGGQDIFIGNPYLKPSQTQSFEASYNHSTRPFSYEATLYYRRSKNTLTDYVYFVSDTVLVTTRENAGKGLAGGLDLSLDANLSSKISYSLSADIFYNELETNFERMETHNSGMSYESKASLTFKPYKPDNIQLSLQSYGRTLSAQGTQSGYTLLNLSYSHQLSPRLKLITNGYNIFDSGRYRNISRTVQVRDDTRVIFRGPNLYIGLSYKLGPIKSDD
ncbi:MAG: outer membrane beta-barrel family protein [Arachidicoccus sp.]|nr:outer membrane beta-barrel family protein [Arachidicoccus sp.]